MFIFSFNSYSQSQNKTLFIDINFILNNSIVGKQMIKNLDNKKSKIEKELNEIENNLETQKINIISQKNILNEQEFKNKIQLYQTDVKKYQQEREKKIQVLDISRKNFTNNFLIKIDEILIEYAKNYKIDFILRKESLIVSNSDLDITNEVIKILDNKYKNINDINTQ